jgi:hypothetical protein
MERGVLATTEHIGEVVASVRHQRQGMCQQAKGDLPKNQRQVETHTNRKTPVEAFWRMSMTGSPVGVMRVIVLVVIMMFQSAHLG